ncbi:MAG: sensor histidine kinase, partial [Caulobacteraceae bacterium]
MTDLPPALERRNAAITGLSLRAQLDLLPQALGLFAVSLPIYVWAGSFAPHAVFMAGSFAIFAINWGAFYLIVNWLKQDEARDPGRRLRVHVLGGLLWAAAVAQIAAFGDGAGPARQPILMLAAGAAVICLFFLAPSLPALLIVGPAAMAGPLFALWRTPQSRDVGALAWGAFALAFLLTLILNGNLRRQFALTAEREALVAEREASLARAEKLARSKSALVATLSHEIRHGLTGLVHVLAALAGANPRAAPSRGQIGAALSAAHDLIAVLNATLDTETAEAGALAVGLVPFDLLAQVRDLAAQTRAQAAERGLEFSIWVEPELEGGQGGAAIADPLRVRQILVSLLANAAKYTTRGRV